MSNFSRALPIALTLTYGCTAVSILLGWLTGAHLAVTFALELVVATHYGTLRVLRSEGVVTRSGKSWSAGGYQFTPVAGQRVRPRDRLLIGLVDRVLVSGFSVLAAFFVVALSWDHVALSWAEVGLWIALTASAIWGERQRYQEWVDSDAPSSADPTTQNDHVTARAAAFFLMLFPVALIGAHTLMAGILLVAQAYLVDLWTARRSEPTDPPLT